MIYVHEYARSRPAHPVVGSAYVTITTEPPIDVRTGEVVAEGNCGVMYGWQLRAHGAYPTVEAARVAVDRRFPGVYEYTGDLARPDGVLAVFLYPRGLDGCAR